MSHLLRLGLWGVCFLAVSVPGDAALNTTGKICQWGCWDEEDEACHAGLNDMQCAEIYGHVEWIQACDCVDEATGLRDNVTVASPRVGSANLYFSVPAFVVLFRASAFAGSDGRILRAAANLGSVQTVDARKARQGGFSEVAWQRSHDAAYVPQ
ncbi:unnamed protein product, partial [Cladocopium goreaui]